MKKIIFDNLIEDEFAKIRNRSTRAICGTFEREIVVKNSQVSSMKAKLKRMGNIIVGTGKAGFGSTKIWFNPIGVNL